MPEPDIIYKTALAHIKNGKVIMVRDNKNSVAFYMLGGTVEPGESEVECLKREVQEEVNARIKAESLKFLAEFQDVAYGKENTFVNIKLYAGELIGEPSPGEEIVEIQYFDSAVNPEHLTPISKQIFKWLKNHDYIS